MILVLLTIISAFIYSVCFTEASLFPLSFIFLTSFFYVLDNAANYRSRFYFGVLWTAVMTLAMGHWLFIALCQHYGLAWWKAALFFIICLLLPLAVIYGFFSLAYSFFKRDGVFFYAAVIPALWVAAEFLKELIPVLIPWGNIAYAVLPFQSFVQVADVTGVYGLTYLVVMVNGLFLVLIKAVRSKSIAWQRIVIAVCLAVGVFGGTILYGQFRSESIRTLADESRPVAATLVQGNFSLEDRWSGMGFYHRVQTYLEMSREEDGADAAQIIVWPETMLNSSARLDDEFFKSLMRAIGPDALLVSGGLKSVPEGGAYNSAYFVSGKGRLQRYDKQILLPYAEKAPMIDWLGSFYTAPDEFVKGRSPICFDTFMGKIAASICFETLYPDYIRQSVRQGAEVLVNISNDAWFGDSAMPYMHLDGARMRAIENRRYVLRASNSGISAIIAPDGRIVKQSRLFEQAKIKGSFRLLQAETIYTRYGNWILYAAAAILFLAGSRQILRSDR